MARAPRPQALRWFSGRSFVLKAKLGVRAAGVGLSSDWRGGGGQGAAPGVAVAQPEVTVLPLGRGLGSCRKTQRCF